MKTILIPNKNNKLECPYFIHIAKVPSKPMTTDMMPLPVMVDCIGKQFQANLISVIPTSINKLGSVTTLMAEGLNAEDFRTEWRKKNPGIEECAVYVYTTDNKYSLV